MADKVTVKARTTLDKDSDVSLVQRELLADHPDGEAVLRRLAMQEVRRLDAGDIPPEKCGDVTAADLLPS